MTSGALARTAARVIGAALLAIAVAMVVWEPWHGPVVVTLSPSHGIDAGDALALPLVVSSLVVWRIAGWRAPGRRSSGWTNVWRWSGPGVAMLLGGLLIVVATFDMAHSGPLLPAGGGTFGQTIRSAGADESVAVGAWSYLAITYDGSVLRLYVDGREVASRPVTERLQHETLPLWLGGNEPYGEYFDGVIDEVRIYDRALTKTEMEADRTEPLESVAAGGFVPAGLVAAYSFDVRSGDAVEDVSGHGNAGEARGATWTPDGRFGGALRFDGSSAVVRVAPSPSLDLATAMTLSAWIKPSSDQSGWRTVVQRETDAYFLDASSAGPDRLARFDDAIAICIVVAAVWLVVSLAWSDGDWLGARRRRSWGLAAAVVLLGATVDVLLAPAGTAFALVFLALWLAASATSALELLTFVVVAVLCAAATWTSLAHIDVPDMRLAAADGGAFRAGLLGVLLLVTGLLRGPFAFRASASSPATG